MIRFFRRLSWSQRAFFVIVVTSPIQFYGYLYLSVHMPIYLAFLHLPALMWPVFCTGLTAYWLREHNQSFYGALEIIVATFLVFSLTMSIAFENDPIDILRVMGTNQLMILQYVGAVYILVRGIDNVVKGSSDPEFWRWASLK